MDLHLFLPVLGRYTSADTAYCKNNVLVWNARLLCTHTLALSPAGPSGMAGANHACSPTPPMQPRMSSEQAIVVRARWQSLASAHPICHTFPVCGSVHPNTLSLLARSEDPANLADNVRKCAKKCFLDLLSDFLSSCLRLTLLLSPT